MQAVSVSPFRDQQDVFSHYFITLLLKPNHEVDCPPSSTQYGLNSVPIMAQTANVYLNFGLWGLSLVPAWLVIREIGVTVGSKKLERELESGGVDQNGQEGQGKEDAIQGRPNELDRESQ